MFCKWHPRKQDPAHIEKASSIAKLFDVQEEVALPAFWLLFWPLRLHSPQCHGHCLDRLRTVHFQDSHHCLLCMDGRKIYHLQKLFHFSLSWSGVKYYLGPWQKAWTSLWHCTCDSLLFFGWENIFGYSVLAAGFHGTVHPWYKFSRVVSSLQHFSCLRQQVNQFCQLIFHPTSASCLHAKKKRWTPAVN